MERESNPFYEKKNTGFLLKKTDSELTPSFIYQPSPEGLMALCDHYSQKYSIDLRCIDLRGTIESGENIYPFFEYLQRTPSISNAMEGQVTGLILSHGKHHVIPLLITRIDGVQHMVVFDSNSGQRIKGYFKIANLFSDAQFYLNAGTRQADEGSCMTDAICILKEALMIHDIIELIKSKPIMQHSAFETGRFFSVPKPDHFSLFKMPEKLLLTAQISKYLREAEADVSVLLRGGRSLQSYRDDFLLPVVFSTEPDRPLTPINGYLYQKGIEHKRILDARWDDCKRQGSDDDIDITNEDRLRFSPMESASDSPYGFSA